MVRLRTWVCLLCAVMVGLLGGCEVSEPEPQPQLTPPPTEPLRGVWLSYIELNELLGGQTPEAAAAALDGVMANCAEKGVNTVFFHVRANSDAYYASSVFPTANAVTDLVQAGFDPLAYAVEAAHRNGLELHAWINPYRIGNTEDTARCDDRFFADGKWYYVPSSLAVQSLLLDGVREIVEGYAVDGIHLDDYFYPESADVPTDAPADFEQADYTAYQNAGGRQSIGDWRRVSVTALIAAVRQVTHADGVQFGVSPSYDLEKNYRVFYADCARWLVEGLVDYLCPQLYFGFLHESADFDAVATQWLSLPRVNGVSLYAGLAAYKVGVAPDRYAGERGAQEWQTDPSLLKKQALRWTELGGNGVSLFRYRYLDADAVRTPETWSDGDRTVQTTYDATIARQQLDSLLALWAE